MLTYSSSSQAVSIEQDPDTKTWLLLLLSLCWLVPGLIGHDPWKPFETQTVDIVYNFVHGHSWVVPKLVDKLYLERNPLFFWIAAGFSNILSSQWLPLHDIVRITTGFFTVVLMCGTGLTAHELYGNHYGRYAVLILIGSIGLIFWGHHASPQIVPLTALSWTLYALILGQRRPLPAGLILGIALLCLFLAGITQELILGSLFIFSTLFCMQWRTINFIVVLGTALIIAVPLGLIWPLCLKQGYPLIYQIWLAQMMRTSLLPDSLSSSLLHHLSILPWFSWPALPLAMCSVWKNRGAWQDKKWRMPIIILIITLIWMIGRGTENNDYVALPVLIPLSLLAAGGITNQPRSLVSALNWFSVMTCGLGALGLWLLWSAIYLHFPASIVQHTRISNPTPGPFNSYIALSFAALMTIIWAWMLLRKCQLGKQAVINWACGLTLIWGLAMSLLLSWLDSGKTYRYVARNVSIALANNKAGCVAGKGLSSTVEAALHYFANISTQSIAVDQSNHCLFLLEQTMDRPPNLTTGIKLLWAGSRYGEQKEKFYLYQLPSR